MPGKTGTFLLSASLHIPSIVHLGAELPGNWRPFAGSPSVHTTDLRAAVGQPFGDSADVPVNPITFLSQQSWSQNDHRAVESRRCHCRKWSDFPKRKIGMEYWWKEMSNFYPLSLSFMKPLEFIVSRSPLFCQGHKICGNVMSVSTSQLKMTRQQAQLRWFSHK